MTYPFKDVREFYLRQFTVELNDIVINTPQDDFKQFINSFEKSTDYIKTNALLETIKILDNPNLVILLT